MAGAPAVVSAQARPPCPVRNIHSRSSSAKKWLNLNGRWGVRVRRQELRTFKRTGPRLLTQVLANHFLVPFVFETSKSGIGDTYLFIHGCGTAEFLTCPQVGRAAAYWCSSAPSIIARRCGSTGSWPGSTKAATYRSASTSPSSQIKAPTRCIARQGSADGPDHSPRQAILGAQVARDLLHAYKRHLADRLARGHRGKLLEKVRVTPSIDGAVRFDARQARPSRGRRCTPSVSFADGVTRGEARPTAGVRASGWRVINPR